jgi:membrane protein
LLGAEINVESEQQTIKDGTKGPERPSQRGAVNAVSVPEEESDEAKKKSAR